MVPEEGKLTVLACRVPHFSQRSPGNNLPLRWDDAPRVDGSGSLVIVVVVVVAVMI
jgi:hypothetical protein